MKFYTVFQAMKESYQNAENYYYEAKLLHKMRSYGHSLSLSTIGLEEMGKSYALFFIILRKLEGLKDQNNDSKYNELLRIIFKSHEKKQRLSYGFSLFSHLFFKEMLITMSEYDYKNEKNFLLILEGMINAIKSANTKSKNLKRWDKEFEFINYLHMKRMEGMYVEIIPYNNIIQGPSSIKVKDSEKALKLLDKYLELGEFITWIKITDEFIEFEKNKKYIRNNINQEANRYLNKLNKVTDQVRDNHS